MVIGNPVIFEQSHAHNAPDLWDRGSMYVCMYVPGIYVRMYRHHISQSNMDQPGKVVNPARGQLNRENEYSPVPVRA